VLLALLEESALGCKAARRCGGCGQQDRGENVHRAAAIVVTSGVQTRTGAYGYNAEQRFVLSNVKDGCNAGAQCASQVPQGAFT
jgi:hypothetical protein